MSYIATQTRFTAETGEAPPANIAKEAKRILTDCLVGNPKLAMPDAIVESASTVMFKPEIQPFMPTPMKMTESVSALWACIGLFANAISRERFGIHRTKSIEIDMYSATLMLCSLILFELEGKHVGADELAARVEHIDTGRIGETYRSLATNIYKTKDDRYFHLHGSLDTTSILTMLSLPQHRLDLEGPEHRQEIKDIYRAAIAQRESESLEIEVNERWRQPGVNCLTVDEYAKTSHGKENIKEPLYSISQVCGDLPSVPWPEADTRQGPLAGIKVLDLTRVIAGPTITKVLALMGADILRISSGTQPDAAFALFDGNTGKRDTDLNLKTPEGRAIFESLLKEADVLVDGYRPDALEKLGFGRKWAHELAKQRNKGIVYCRENCYGWRGEWSARAGYQQISDCVSGAAWEQGKFLGLNEPVIPLLPNSDYQTGLVGAIAIMQALLKRSSEGGSYNVDVSLTQFNNWYIRDLGLHNPKTQASLREMHQQFQPRHDTEIFELISMTVATTKTAVQPWTGPLWDPTRFKTGPIRWGIEGEMARYLDWSKIVTCKGDDGEQAVVFDFHRGSCMPGSDEPKWL